MCNLKYTVFLGKKYNSKELTVMIMLTWEGCKCMNQSTEWANTLLWLSNRRWWWWRWMLCRSIARPTGCQIFEISCQNRYGAQQRPRQFGIDPDVVDFMVCNCVWSLSSYLSILSFPKRLAKCKNCKSDDMSGHLQIKIKMYEGYTTCSNK